LVKKYPDDDRNRAAAAMLDAFAATPEEDVEPDLWAKIEVQRRRTTPYRRLRAQLVFQTDRRP
jgi:hypothetical protein